MGASRACASDRQGFDLKPLRGVLGRPNIVPPWTSRDHRIDARTTMDTYDNVYLPQSPHRSTDRSGAQAPEDHPNRHEFKGRNPCAARPPQGR
eukprot:6459986-Prymnesium_polylepis.1